MTHKSRRDIQRAVEKLAAGTEYPEASIITLLSTACNGGEIEIVDHERWLWRIDGEVMHVRQEAREQLLGD